MKGNYNILKGDILRTELQFPVYLQLFHYLEKRMVRINYINLFRNFWDPR